MQAFDHARILVVGGAGFVGSNLVKELMATSSAYVLIVDNLLSAERFNVPLATKVDFVEGSIASDAVLRQLPTDLDYVFHLAGYQGQQNSIANPLADHENNTVATIKLCEFLKTNRSLKRMVYVSGDCVLPERTDRSFKGAPDDDPISLWLKGPHQISKLARECYANYYFDQHGQPIVQARFQNAYGPGEILGAGRWRGTMETVWRSVIPTFVYRAIKNLPLRVDNGGSASSNFTFARDIARGLLLCAANGIAGEAYDLASGEDCSILDLARMINELANSTAPLELTPMRGWDCSGRRSVSTKQEEIHFAAEVKLRDGLRQTIQWTRANLPLIERCIAKHETQMKVAA